MATRFSHGLGESKRQTMGDVPKAIARTRRRPKSITTKAAASTSLERVVRCCTPSPQDPTGPLPVSRTLDDDRFRGVTGKARIVPAVGRPTGGAAV